MKPPAGTAAHPGRGRLGPFLYGALFTLGWPLLLGRLAWRIDGSGFLAWPQPLTPPAGLALLTGGLALMAHAMRLLLREGEGLPMNAYPTRRLVTRGPFALLPHPIYAGFSAAVAGAAVLANSPAGLWIAAPLSALAAAALVAGYEGPALRARLGAPLAPPLLALPEAGEGSLSWSRRAAGALLALAPWAALYALFSRMPEPAGAADLRLSFEAGWPRPGWAAWVYSAAYPLVLAGALAPRSGTETRRLVLAAWWVTGLGFALMLLLPGRAAYLPGDHGGLTAWLMDANRALDADWLAFPSFHAAWGALAAIVLARRFPAARYPLAALVLLIAATCVLTGAHALVDVLGGLALAGAAWRHEAIWGRALALAERLANRLGGLRVGALRILSHALWSALGAGAGTLLLLALIGEAQGPAALAVIALGLLGAAAWGQRFEGGGRLARPFGSFGFLAGAAAGILLLAAHDPSRGLLVTAGIAAAAPLAQAIGRLRCLEQGCCHGCRTLRAPGIVVRHPLSRVTVIAGLGGLPIHPTPLYAMLANLAVLAVTLRLWQLGAPAGLVAGASLALSGLARFVEERFRGEPQTPWLGGLNLYQWCAAAMFLAGLFVAMLPGAPVPPPGMPAPLGLALAGLVAVAVAAAMSVDAPGSRRPFSRLTPLAPGEAPEAAPPVEGSAATPRGAPPIPARP